MKKNVKTEILRTLTVVSVVLLIGFTLTACQTSIPLKKIILPTEKPLISVGDEDFAFPTKDPSIVDGKKFFQANCAQCHGFGDKGDRDFTLQYVNDTTPQDLFKAFSINKNHPVVTKNLSIQERWDVVMYIRSELFGLPNDIVDIKTKFGSNCAVCHGTRGFADGSLQYWLNPPPANFNQFDRLYDRTDNKIFNEIKNGIPWTAMPPWGGRHDKDKEFDFDDNFIWELVKYVRTFGYDTEADALDALMHKDENLPEVKGVE